ncbi:Modulator of FtsH protease HflC [Aquisphaera giovannonii]|uniref:Modulator of FtsH protease HflC n=1 Tax=Aquisphaera giovannonii TaxID=406548 RepID=A0A5B9WD02_9BACT|nr:protease modulator HflC [Aquisphaera giovannonii]QEH37945.1 Modulator of FtsH protease HflC [Aquisphaera giovannonii]
MNTRRWIPVAVGVALILIAPLMRSVCYVVTERELAVLLQFGQPVASRTEPGLYFKLPFIQEVLRLPKTLQVWHGTHESEKLVDVPTADGKKVEVTVWAVWRISDPVQFVRTLRTVPNAESRVKEFVRSMARDTITTNNLAEIVRSTNRKMTYTLGLPPEMVAAATAAATGPAGDAKSASSLDQAIPDFVVPPEAREPIHLGRTKIMDAIRLDAQHGLAQDGKNDAQIQGRGRGIELVDVGLSRIEFVPQVREAAFDRAVSLMEAIAAKTIAEGQQRKQEILNRTQAEVQKIEGEGKQEANILKGKADADIIDAYAKAIRETGEFYTFVRTLEAYKEALKGDTRLILTTDSSLLRMIKSLDPPGPRPTPGPTADAPSRTAASLSAGK